jgi:C-terminal processing protease CtpA/Prc
MAHNPANLIVGSYPTAGVEASVSPWLLPDGLSFRASLGLLLDPDGNVFLEGTGVVPTVKVPITPESLLSDDDLELAAAEAALGG